ncbi:MAG: hypothetical protein M3464_00485 [Chloroflexota bacterium]|nr:hypothetical protein [Chloroflexota bacterium]
MPLHPAKAPPEALAAALRGVQRLSSTGNAGDLSGAALAASSLTVPHQVFVMRTSDLANGASIEDQARPFSWRHLVQDSDRQTIASVEVTRDSSSGSFQFAQFEPGPFAKSTEAEIKTALALHVVQTGSYELRLLRIPALYAVALWLKDEGLGPDLLLPLAPTPLGVEADHVYTADQFLDALRDLAKRRGSTRPGGDVAGWSTAGSLSGS